MVLAALASLLGTALPSRAAVISVADQLRGITMTEAQCAALPQAVWLSVVDGNLDRNLGRNFCIRYYLSTAGGEGTRPAVFVQGDRLGRLNLKTGEFSPGPRDKDLDTDDFVRMADVLSKQTATAAIYLARPGLDGSSGDHRIRHTTLELTVVNAALDAIKRRHGFEGFHMIGQSDAGWRHAGAAHRHRLRGDRFRPSGLRQGTALAPTRPRTISTSPMRCR